MYKKTVDKTGWRGKEEYFPSVVCLLGKGARRLPGGGTGVPSTTGQGSGGVAESGTWRPPH